MSDDEERLLNCCKYNVYGLAELSQLAFSGINLNVQGVSGRTALHWTVEHNNLELTLLLLQAGANTEVQPYTGLTPLHLAAMHNHTHLIDCLLVYGANIEAQDRNGLTPLHWATGKGNKGSVGKLLAANANLHAKNFANITPIQLAFLSGQCVADYLNAYQRNSHHRLAMLTVPKQNFMPSLKDDSSLGGEKRKRVDEPLLAEDSVQTRESKQIFNQHSSSFFTDKALEPTAKEERVELDHAVEKLEAPEDTCNLQVTSRCSF